MAFGEVRLLPGVNVEQTPTLLQAQVSKSQLIRYRDGLVQKYGGWSSYFANPVLGVPRELHAWEDLNGTDHLGVGTTTQLGVLTGSSYVDVTPQQKTSDFVPNITATNASKTITITDTNVSNVTAYDSVYFNTPVSVGGVVLGGLYAMATGGASSYTITAGAAAAQTSTLTTNNTTAAGNATLHIAVVPAWVVKGMLILDTTASGLIPNNTTVVSTTGSTVVMNNNATGAGVGNGDTIAFVGIPVFTTTLNSSTVSVAFAAHGRAVGDVVNFPIATTNSGVTISGNYTVVVVTDANNYSIVTSAQASAAATFTMNSGNAEILYYIQIQPGGLGVGYGSGTYGTGGYGLSQAVPNQQGTNITATDWTSDNWGQIWLACPANGAVYAYDPVAGFANAGVVATAPPFNAGLFISQQQQILVCYGSTQNEGIGVAQDPLLVKWSNQGDYTNFTPAATNQAGSFRLSSGSKLMGGLATPQNNLLWTDIDLWAMGYMGFPLVFGFNKIGAGAGLIGRHAMMQLRGNVYWMGPSNFYQFSGSGVAAMPCPVWDYVFQNLNTAFQTNVRAMPNTPFNEAGWEFPSNASASGENDSYVKFNLTEPNGPWDYGTLARSAWIDQGVLGNPIGASPQGMLFQHETTNNAASSTLAASFTTGYFYIGEGEDFYIIDRIFPDFIWTTFGGSGSATVQITLNVVNYPGDTPTSYGPYSVTSATQYVALRARGRAGSFTIASNDLGSFWRIGKIRYRFGPGGRR